jgi:hypothetical protein
MARVDPFNYRQFSPRRKKLRIGGKLLDNLRISFGPIDTRMNDLLVLATLLEGQKHGYLLKREAGFIFGDATLLATLRFWRRYAFGDAALLATLRCTTILFTHYCAALLLLARLY